MCCAFDELGEWRTLQKATVRLGRLHSLALSMGYDQRMSELKRSSTSLGAN
jgi:hypothetical protein